MSKSIDEFEPYSIEQNGIIYEVEPQYTTVVDHYGSDGSVELSHEESAGYSTIVGYSGQSSHLDFTFAEPQDEIDIDIDEEIQSIAINFSNLKNAFFSSSHQINYDVLLNCDALETVELLKIFLNTNSQIVGKINFQGIDNSILVKLLAKTCEKFNKSASFSEQIPKRNVITDKSVEVEIDNIIQDIQLQLLAKKEKLEETKIKIDEDNIKDANETREEIENIDTESYKKQIEELKKQIPKKIKEQFKHLSIEEIMAKYNGKISELINLVEKIESEKQLLVAQLDVMAKGKVIDDINAEIDRTIDSTDLISNEIADFWTLANNSDNSRLGIIRTRKTESYPADGPRRVLNEEAICSSLLEFELSKKFGKPIDTERLEKYIISPDYDHIRLESEFLDETSDEISLQQKNEINMRKEKIKKLKEKAEKHPKQYNKPGIITLYSQKKDNRSNVIKQTQFKMEITQKELISLGLDPADFGWREIEKAKVDSGDIARASKEKGIKKSLISRIASVFSREKEGREK